MFSTRFHRRNVDVLARDIAVIARLEASLCRPDKPNAVPRGTPDFSRLKRHIPDLKV